MSSPPNRPLPPGANPAPVSSETGAFLGCGATKKGPGGPPLTLRILSILWFYKPGKIFTALKARL